MRMELLSRALTDPAQCAAAGLVFKDLLLDGTSMRSDGSLTYTRGSLFNFFGNT